MKSIKNLTILSNRQKPTQLASIEGNQTIKSKRQRLQVMCAFHPSQIITNFCKNPTCLLPLCPKCVKIHIDEHAQSGSYAKFEAIQDCLDQAHSSFLNSFSEISKLQKISADIQDNYHRKKQRIHKDFQRIKTIAFEYLQDIFKQYQQIIKLQVTKDDRVFTEYLIQYHDSISQMMENCRNATKKFNTKATLMQGLIGFYTKGDYTQNLRQCEDKLNKMTMSRLQIIIHQNQLQKMKDVIKRYLRMGENTTSLQQLAHQNKLIKSINIEDTISRAYKSEKQFARERTNGATSINNFSDNGKQLSQLLLNDNFLNFKTPLDNFSLQRSRNTRVFLKSNNSKLQS